MNLLFYSLLLLSAVLIIGMWRHFHHELMNTKKEPEASSSSYMLEEAVTLLQEPCTCYDQRVSSDMQCDRCQRKQDFIIRYYRKVYP